MTSVILTAVVLLTSLRSDSVAAQSSHVLSRSTTTLNRTASGHDRNLHVLTPFTLTNDEDECDRVMNLSASQRCEFVLNTPDCALEGGFIKYPWITFCLLPPQLLPLAIFLYILWLIVLFLVLGLIASDFFCPNLSAISSTLRLTHNVAGVTFLALGNGAPDVFSAVAAFSRPQTAGLAIGALFGAGIFVTTVVAGSIALVKPFTAASRPFLRDVIFYMAAVFWTFTFIFRRHVELREAIGYVGLYALYVITVVVSAYVYNRRTRGPSGTVQDPDFAQHIQDSYMENLNANIHRPEEYEPLLPFTESTTKIFLKAINPVDIRTWRRIHWGWKVLKIIQLPFQVVLVLTVPLVDSDKEDGNWKRPLNCLHLVTAPLVCVLTFNSGAYGLYLIEGELPVWVLTALIGGFLSAIVFCTTTNERPPPYHFLFSFLGFVVSALWINVVASEVVNILHLLGVILRLSNTVLGLTLLAWGNSIGDCFADITIARQGYPRMAISACFGGIIFSIL